MRLDITPIVSKDPPSGKDIVCVDRRGRFRVETILIHLRILVLTWLSPSTSRGRSGETA